MCMGLTNWEGRLLSLTAGHAALTTMEEVDSWEVREDLRVLQLNTSRQLINIKFFSFQDAER